MYLVIVVLHEEALTLSYTVCGGEVDLSEILQTAKEKISAIPDEIFVIQNTEITHRFGDDGWR